MVYTFCQSHNYEIKIYDFFLLYWAWDDFDYGENYSAYWDTATKDNIEDLVIKTANDWVAKYFETIKIIIM